MSESKVSVSVLAVEGDFDQEHLLYEGLSADSALSCSLEIVGTEIQAEAEPDAVVVILTSTSIQDARFNDRIG